MRQKILSMITLAAMTLLPQGAWADYVIFSMSSVTSLSGTGVSENVVPAGGDATVNATFVNGSAIVHNGHGSTDKAMLDTSFTPPKIDVTGSSGSYFKVTLTAGTIQAGDIISFVGSSYMINISHTNSTSSVNSTSGYVVPEASPLIGCSSIYVYRTTSGSSYAKFSSFTISRPNTTLTLDSYGYATFASTYPLDLANMSATTAPTAYKASVSSSTVNFTAVSEAVAANTGILLVGGAGETVTIPIAASGTDISATNAFEVNEAGTTFDAESGNTYFGMRKNQATLTFAPFNPSTVAIPANKAYLKVLTSSLSANELTFVFDEENNGDVTGVNEVRGQKSEVRGEYYNLAGQRVALPTKGLYIVNGRKVIVK